MISRYYRIEHQGEPFPEHISVYYDGKQYWACFGTPGLKKKRDWKGWVPFGNMNCMLNSFGLPTIGKENAYQLIMLKEWDTVRKQGWDLDQELDDLRRREDQIKIWRTAGTVALFTSSGDQLKFPQMVTEYGKDWYSPSDYAQILTGCGKQSMLPSKDIVPEAVRRDWDRATAAGKAKPRDTQQGYYDSDTFELMTPEYLPRADLSMKNLIKSYNQYSIKKFDLYGYDNNVRYNRKRVPVVRDILGRLVPFPPSPLGERHSAYKRFGQRDRVPEKNWPLDIRTMLNIYHVVPSIHDVKVHTDCCNKCYITYKDKSTNTRCYLTYADKNNYFVKPYGGKSFDEVIQWYMKTTHNVRLAEWARYKIEGSHADKAWVHGMRYWYNKWVNKYGHEMPALGCNPLDKSDEEFLDYLVKLDIHWYSMVMPVVPANVPTGAKQWLGNIALCWHNVQEFIS